MSEPRNPQVPTLPLRAWHAWRGRGARYVWHKTLRRTLERWPGWKRRLLYDDPRAYWTLRGGLEYYREQEGQPARTDRSHWLAERVASYQPSSVLEVGCGYGKQLRSIRERLPSARLTGLDFSPSQLELARSHLDGQGPINLVLGSGARLPFPDQSFDLVLTSAVILHNPPPIAEAIRREVLRVARQFTAHNEDTDVTYNRYGYDTAAWYRDARIPLAESGPIPTDPPPSPSQFCVAEVARWRA
ncbi:MAG: class I SAM-dependent methyltransferase [Isosphaeraceae bacterium]